VAVAGHCIVCPIPPSFLYIDILLKYLLLEDNIPARTSPGLTRSSLATTRNRVAYDICVPRKILRDNPDLSYVQPEGNYYFKTSDSYKILKSCSINISDCLKSPGTCDSYPGDVLAGMLSLISLFINA
jgi:hypothetical protein